MFVIDGFVAVKGDVNLGTVARIPPEGSVLKDVIWQSLQAGDVLDHASMWPIFARG